ncbi:MAG: methyltransferase [Clostridiales bacterium]|nr:methyltransferase [Clostridiales bacterium]
MADYLSTFVVGLEEQVAELLPRRLAGARALRMLNGMVQYRYDGPARLIDKLPFLHNTYSVLIAFPRQAQDFEAMVAAAGSKRCHYLPGKETFRVRFVRENTFLSVPPKVLHAAERLVTKATGMRPSRGQAETELWYIIRSESMGYYAQLLTRKPDKTAPGALRGDLAYLIATLAQTDRDSVVLDPFCGSGALIRALRDHLPYGRLYASDSDAQAVGRLKREPLLTESQGEVRVADALTLAHLADASVDAVVTDPPWGDFKALPDEAAFYQRMLMSLRRVLKPDGRAVLLTARKRELAQAAAGGGFLVADTVHTLVNGKKTAAFVLLPRQENETESR